MRMSSAWETIEMHQPTPITLPPALCIEHNLSVLPITLPAKINDRFRFAGFASAEFGLDHDSL